MQRRHEHGASDWVRAVFYENTDVTDAHAPPGLPASPPLAAQPQPVRAVFCESTARHPIQLALLDGSRARGMRAHQSELCGSDDVGGGR